MKRILIALTALSLSGCATTQFVRPPGDRLVCLGEPSRPAGTGEAYQDAEGRERRAVTDTENAEYLRSLRAAGQDCREDVNWLRVWFDSLE